MSISLKDVEHIASLSRIELSEGEKEKFGRELSAILGFIETLNAVDTEGVELMTGGTALENRMREDGIVDDALEGGAAALLDAAAEKKEGWVKVKKIFQ